MARLLVIEDQPNDLRIAAETARSAGITDVEARTSSQAAISYLEKGLRQELPFRMGSCSTWTWGMRAAMSCCVSGIVRQN
jgi:CheY-like chemotaxis protein